MTSLTDLIRQPAIAALAWALIHFVWQGALLGGAAFLALRVLRPERAATRYAIGVCTLAVMLVTCAATFLVVARPASPDPIPASRATVAPAIVEAPAAAYVLADAAVRGPVPAAATTVAPWATATSDPRLLQIIVIAWAIGVLAMTARLAGGWLLARRLATRASRAVSPSVEAAAREIARTLRIRRAVAILESSAVAVPTLIGWLKPVVLLPASALSGLSPDQLQAILAHELAHVRRHDYLVNLLQSMVETLLFYHPATWWVSAQIRAEREHCCDDLAVDVCGDRLVYATALAELTTLAAHRQLALAATDGSLLNRVRRILGAQRSVHPEPTPAWPLLALVVLAVGAGSLTADAVDTQAAPPPAAATATTPANAPPPAEAATAQATAADQVEAARHAEEDQRVSNKIAEQRQTAEIAEQLRAQADWLNREAARLRAEADRIRRDEAQLRNGRPAPIAPEPPQPPEAPAAFIAPAPPAPPAPPASPASPGSFASLAPPAPPAPPASPASPASPAPPAPPAPPQGLESGGSGNMTWSNNGEKFSMKWNGTFRLSDDERDIEGIEVGESLTITDGGISTDRVEIRGTRTGVERNYWHNGSRRDYEPEGRKFLAAALDRMIRNSGAFARERVARRLTRGGPDAVLAMIDDLSDSSYVRRVYYSELFKQSPPSDAILARVLQRIPNEIKSDYDKSTLLTLAAQQPSMNDAHRVSIARAVKTISSDYDQRRALTAILKTRPLSAALAAAVLDATASINSNYDRSQMLVLVVENGGLTSSTSAAFMAQVRSMSSSYDQRRVLTAVSTHATLADGVGVAAVQAAGSMTSAHELSMTLVGLIERGGLTDASAPAFFESAARISSAHELSRVLRKALEHGASNDRILEGVLRLAPKVSSGHERANVLIDAAGRARITAEARELYIAASKGLGSHDENRALAALVRGEARR